MTASKLPHNITMSLPEMNAREGEQVGSWDDEGSVGAGAVISSLFFENKGNCSYDVAVAYTVIAVSLHRTNSHLFHLHYMKVPKTMKIYV